MPPLTSAAAVATAWFALRAVLWITACVLLADLITGMVHWAEDHYGDPAWPILGQLVFAPNLEHHEKPRAFLAGGWWGANWPQIILAVAVAGGTAAVGWLTWQLALVLTLLANANTVHQWAHMTVKETPRLVGWMQRMRLIQDRIHHGGHHGGRRDTAYCALTPWVNPVVDRIGLWRAIEAVIKCTTGVKPRVDACVARREQAARAR